GRSDVRGGPRQRLSRSLASYRGQVAGSAPHRRPSHRIQARPAHQLRSGTLRRDRRRGIAPVDPGPQLAALDAPVLPVAIRPSAIGALRSKFHAGTSKSNSALLPLREVVIPPRYKRWAMDANSPRDGEGGGR